MIIDDDLDAVDPSPASRSTPARDLALRGVHALHLERERSSDAVGVLLEIADGARDYDFALAATLAAERGDGLP